MNPMAQHPRSTATGRGIGHGRAAASKKSRVCGKFTQQMTSLGDMLDSTSCSFIRCIKPNAEMKAGIFENAYVLEQLRSLGIVQTCEVLKAGLPTRIRFEELYHLYQPVLPSALASLFDNLSYVDFAEAILWALQVPPDAFQKGRTRVFFKTGKVGTLCGSARRVVSSSFLLAHLPSVDCCGLGEHSTRPTQRRRRLRGRT